MDHISRFDKRVRSGAYAARSRRFRPYGQRRQASSIRRESWAATKSIRRFTSFLVVAFLVFVAFGGDRDLTSTLQEASTPVRNLFSTSGSDADQVASRPSLRVSMPICSGGKRVNCVVDGDTIWLNGEKIRIQGFNTPEMSGACARERRLAVEARDALRRVLDGQAISIERNGRDRYGRTLATVRVNGRNVGDALISRGLAHEWRGYKERWC